ncbi:UNVERIFIED_CONTAM: Retrovirus-related Pol polyprotein from transposon RE1 [Sesamum calycinum]|uniref:Retrovirus-related Pol polyprotein from transposon RE1 n=1 Tax=Sesamum calycinum TaxID=2727403 RepID=A0AAW2MQL4_9LAMI
MGDSRRRVTLPEDSSTSSSGPRKANWRIRRQRIQRLYTTSKQQWQIIFFQELVLLHRQKKHGAFCRKNIKAVQRFMQSPSQVHYVAAKRILRYLRGTKDFGIWYKSTNDAKLVGYTDSDWAGSVDDMKSTSGYTFSLGSGIFTWASKKQATVAQSSAEAEYIAAAATSNHAIWLRRILEDIGEKQEEPTTIYCDNKSAIAITKNPVQHNRTKHIDIKYHSLREATTRGEIELKYCSTEEH